MVLDLPYEKILQPERLFYFLAGTLIVSLPPAIYLETYYILLLPFALLFGLLTLADVSKIYFLLLLILPLTIEVYLPNGLGIDLPGELLLIGLTVVSPFLLLLHFRKQDWDYLTHPVSLLLMLHLGWIIVAAVLAKDQLIGFKFVLAKIWYVIPFYFFSIYILKNRTRYLNFFWSLLLPIFASIIYVMSRHAMSGFAFSEINSAVSPIYRNHVNYGLLMVVFLPFVWAFRTWYAEGSLHRRALSAIGLLMIIAIYFTYTRAAQIAVILAVVVYFVIRQRLVVPAMIFAALSLTVVFSYLAWNNTYLEYAPQYERTITHDEFDNLLEATVKMEDISTVERINRWISGVLMVKEEPWSGFGPGSFYFQYKKFMVSSFVTYVSDNPDKSGIHNYYLMTLVEQGIPGLVIFLMFLIAVVLSGSRLYHLLTDPRTKALVMAATISIILTAIVIFINDLLEAIKVGGVFFISTAILVKEAVRYKRSLDLSEDQSTHPA